MKKIVFMFAVGMLVSAMSYSRDTVSDYSINDAMALESAKSALGSDIVFYFGEKDVVSQNKITKNFGEVRTNKKTNAFNKTDLEACQWVFLTAMIALKDRAIREGGNAVIGIKSNYKNRLTSSADTFQCGAGKFIAGTAFVGTIVTLKK